MLHLLFLGLAMSTLGVEQWEPLKKGDIIDIIAPASALGNDELYLEQAAQCIRKLGFTPRYSKNIVDSREGPIFANSDIERYQDLKRALYDSSSKAIWAYRGGYGVARILPMLLNDQKPSKIKPIIGFSDITSLSIFLHEKWQYPSIHGPVLSQCIKKELPFENFESTRDILRGNTKKVKYQMFILNEVAKNKKITAPLVGGNLTMIRHTLATAWQLDAGNKIVFFEEVGEAAYSLDRSLTHLLQTGFFKDVKAIIFGDIIPRNSNENVQLSQKVLQNFADSIEIPVYSVKDIGHGAKNRPLPIGTQANIIVEGQNALLSVETGIRDN